MQVLWEVTMIQQRMPFPTIQNVSVFYYIYHHPVRQPLMKIHKIAIFLVAVKSSIFYQG